MIPFYHILFGIFFILIIKLIKPSISWKMLILIFLASVLIDVDHYLVYLIRIHDLNLIKAYTWFDTRNGMGLETGLHVLHTIETYLLLFVLYYIFYKKYKKTEKKIYLILKNISLAILIGFAFHLIIDHISITIMGGRRTYSIIHWWLTR